MSAGHEPLICPTCGGTTFRDRDGGPDGWHDDIVWTDDVCVNCGTYLHGWTNEWITEDGREGCGEEGTE